MKKLFLLFILILASVLFYQLYQEKLFIFQEASSFPYVEPGDYVGYVHFTTEDEHEPLYIRSTVTPSLYIAWNEPVVEKVVTWSMISKNTLGTKEPLEIMHNGNLYYFSGKETDTGSFEGVVRDIEEHVGVFFFEALQIERSEVDLQDKKYIQSLVSEKSIVGMKRQRSTMQADMYRNEKERFEELLYDKSDAVKSIEDKFKEERAQVVELKGELKTLRAKRKTLADEQALAQKIQPYGRLVALAREGMQRERRVLGELQKDERVSRRKHVRMSNIERGRALHDVKEAIDKERLKIAELELMQERYGRR